MAPKKPFSTTPFRSPEFTNFPDVDQEDTISLNKKTLEAQGEVHREKKLFLTKYTYTYENCNNPLVAVKKCFTHSIYDGELLIGVLKANMFGSMYSFFQFDKQYYSQKMICKLRNNPTTKLTIDNSVIGFNNSRKCKININNGTDLRPDLDYNLHRRTSTNNRIGDAIKNITLNAGLKPDKEAYSYDASENLYIEYECSIFRRKKPRDFVVVYSPSSILYTNELQTMPRIREKYKKGEFHDLVILTNKKPVFSQETESFVLNFSGRVTKPSVKNFQIAHPNDPDYVSLTFGKTGDDDFILDFKFPWTPLQAFAIALSALDSKIWCE